MLYLRHYNHILSKILIPFQVMILIETVFYLTFNFIPKKEPKACTFEKVENSENLEDSSQKFLKTQATLSLPHQILV